MIFAFDRPRLLWEWLAQTAQQEAVVGRQFWRWFYLLLSTGAVDVAPYTRREISPAQQWQRSDAFLSSKFYLTNKDKA
ncbi:hypothetical protein KCP70_22090 [Salmonella enterica subsp. enterica]|nr:hypothetical protein KCP70_22090 [Salmonella enterica subsp. enterica]